MKQNELARLRQRWRDLARESPSHALCRGVDKLWVYGYSPIAKIVRRNDSFELNGTRYPYFVHQYNATWRGERTVEIPLALEFLANHRGRRILELGNVMSYYADVSHDVIDKYETAPGVKNIDFIDFIPDFRYDAFLSVSTIEHIGWDESPRQPEKVHAALRKIASTVHNTDNVLVTFPLGYNSHLDLLAYEGNLGFKNSATLIRFNRHNEWREAPLEEALKAPYGSKYPRANSLFVGMGLTA